MRRIVLMLCVATLGVAGMRMPTSAHAQNVDPKTLLQCFHTSYAALIGTDGITDHRFTSSADCSLFVLRGGIVVTAGKAGTCLNGGFSRRTTSNATTDFTPYDPAGFAGEAACVLYVSEGGRPVIPGNLVFQAVVLTDTSGARTFSIRGSFQVPTTMPSNGFTFNPIPAAGVYFLDGPPLAAVGTAGSFTHVEPNARIASVIGYCTKPEDIIACTHGTTTCASALATGSVGFSLGVNFVPATPHAAPIPGTIAIIHSSLFHGWLVQVSIGQLATVDGLLTTGISLRC